jgi:heptosyltransferase III
MEPSVSSPLRSRVLVIFPGALGDLICLVPTLRALARRHSDSNLDLMARDELARFAVGRLGIAAGYSIDRREVSGLFGADADAYQSTQLFRPFKRIYSFFASGDAHFRKALERAAFPAKVSFHAFRPETAEHIALGYLGVIGASETRLCSRIDLFQDDIEAAKRLLGGIGLSGKRLLLIFPGSGSLKKNWPTENFAVLARGLGPALQPLAIRGPAEIDDEGSFAASKIPTLRDLPLGTVAGLASLAAGFVGNDSGVSHLAAAAGVRGVVLFGPTDPNRWRPLGETVVMCSEPIKDLPPSAVIAAVNSLFAKI